MMTIKRLNKLILGVWEGS